MTINLSAKIRTLLGKKAKIVRQQGKIPAVLYGHGLENKNLELDYNVFDKAYKESGESTIIDLDVDGQSVKALVSEVKFSPVSGRYEHVDFHQIKMDEKVHANVEIKFIGESKAVKELGGVLVHNISEIEIKCFPGDLMSEIDVDISKLDNFHDSITIGDLNLSDKIEIIGHEPEDVIVNVIAPKAEKEEVVAEPVAEETATTEKSTEEKGE